MSVKTNQSAVYSGTEGSSITGEIWYQPWEQLTIEFNRLPKGLKKGSIYEFQGHKWLVSSTDKRKKQAVILRYIEDFTPERVTMLGAVE